MKQRIETLLRENIHGVFGEPDAQKRRATIARLWADDGIFVDHNALYEGHAGVEHAAASLVNKFPDFTFTEHGEIQVIEGAGKLDWGFGPVGAAEVVTGTDILVTKGDKIGAIYTFLDPAKK